MNEMIHQTDAKYLIITSDDFGVTNSVNRGILRGFKQGVLSSSNLMACCPWFPQAAEMSRLNSLPVGVHLTLTCEWKYMKWGPLSEGKSLVDNKGYFFPDYEPLLRQASDEDIRNEYRAQIDRVLSFEIEPTHVETHMLPSFHDFDFNNRIQELATEVGSEYGLIYTYETLNGSLIHFDSEFLLSEHEYSELLAFLSSRKAGYHHIICHCSESSTEQENLTSPDDGTFPWALSIRERDTRIITSQEFRKFLEELKFELIAIPRLRKNR